MADVEEKAEVERSGDAARRGTKQETALTQSTQGREVEGTVSLQEMAEEFLRKNFKPVLECILTNVRDHKHLPSARLLMELAKMVVTEGEAPVEAYQSVTEVIWKSYLKVQRRK